MPSKLVVFDIDGTLTDSVAIHQQCFYQTLSRFNFTRIDENWSGYAHHTDSYIFVENYLTNYGAYPDSEDFRDVDVCLHQFMEQAVAQKHINLLPGAGRFVHQLEDDTDYALVYATGSMRKAAELKLADAGLQVDNRLLASASEFCQRENIVRNAIERAQRHYAVNHFDKITVLGDGVWDLLTARNLGLDFIGIGSGEQAARLHREGASHVVADFQNNDVMMRMLH